MKTSVVWHGLSVAILLTLLASCRTTADIVEPENISVLANGDALRKDASQYAKEVGVSLDEAIRRLELQTTIGKLDAKLTTGEPDTFGGLWIQHEPTFRVIVNMTGSVEKVASYTRGTSLTSIVEHHKVSKTLKQLEAEQVQASETTEALGMQSESSIDVFNNQVVLRVQSQQKLNSALTALSSQNLQPSELSPTAASFMGLPKGIKIEETPTFAVLMENGIAGQLVRDPNNVPCTTGYSVIKDGKKGITTAGHCEAANYGSTKVPIVFQREYFGGPNDFQWHTSSRLTIKPWARDSETDTGTPGYRYIYDVANRPDQPINAFVCKYGQTTKHTCGRIQTKTSGNFFPNRVPAATYTFIRLRSRVNGQRVILAKGGDSGGPVYVGHQAYGMVSAGFDQRDPNYGDMIYMAINYVTDQGFRVLFEPRP